MLFNRPQNTERLKLLAFSHELGTVAVPNVTSPWAVVSAYYGDIESGNYAEAWALIGSGSTTGQTYQQFVSGFACTGSQQLTDDGTSGDQVAFSLTATDSCTGQIHTYSGTDTVQNGTIVAAACGILLMTAAILSAVRSCSRRPTMGA